MMKYLCDQMLGTLATWLRLIGYDTEYIRVNISHDEILEKAQEERRILITRDNLLIQKAKKRKIDHFPLFSMDIDEQIRLVLENKTIDESKILSRCSVCNADLQVAGKSQVEGKVPERIFNEYTFFWRCPQCERVYWRGSHYDMIKEKIKELQQ